MNHPRSIFPGIVCAAAWGWCAGAPAALASSVGVLLYLFAMDYLDTYRDVLVLDLLSREGVVENWAVLEVARSRGTSASHLLWMVRRGLMTNAGRCAITPLGRSYLDGYGRRWGYVLPEAPW